MTRFSAPVLLLASMALAISVLLPVPVRAEPIKIIYGFDREFPPFTFERDGVPVGFDIDLLNAVLEGKDVKITYRPMTFDRVLLDLSGGNINLASTMVRTEQRELLYLFSDRFTIPLKMKLFTKIQNRVAHPRELRGMRVAVKEDTLYQLTLEQYGGLNIKLFDSDFDALTALQNEDVEAYGGADRTVYYLLRQMGYTNISAIGTPLRVSRLYFAVNREHPEILELINEGMRTIMENGEYERIFRKWFVPELLTDEVDALITSAQEAAVNAYAPYSQSPVGAALLGMSGQIYTGVSVENGVWSLSETALKVAILNAVLNGEAEFKAVVAVLPDGRILSPTAEERRMLIEFSQEVQVITEPEPGRQVIRLITELLPEPAETILPRNYPFPSQ